jgi:hypothetical protein
MTVSLQNFFPISLTYSNGCILLSISPICFSTDLPLMRELASSNPWAVVTGVLISASFLISSTRYSSTSSMGDLCPAWPLSLFSLCLTVWVVIMIESGTEYFFFAKTIISFSEPFRSLAFLLLFLLFISWNSRTASCVAFLIDSESSLVASLEDPFGRPTAFESAQYSLTISAFFFVFVLSFIYGRSFKLALLLGWVDICCLPLFCCITCFRFQRWLTARGARGARGDICRCSWYNTIIIS